MEQTKVVNEFPRDLKSKEQLILELEEYERRFSKMLENAPLASIILDSNWKLMFANEYFLQITGWKSEQVIDKDWVDTFIPEDKQIKTRNTNVLISGGFVEVPPYQDTQICSRSGRLLVIGWNNTVLKDSNGEFLGVSSVGEDLSSKRPSQISRVDVHSHATCDGQEGHQHDETCQLLQNYTTHTEDPASGNMLEGLVLVKVLKSLGGDKGHVQLAVNKATGEKVAVKSMRKDLMKPEEIERARREIEIMQQLTKLNNPYIIKLIGAEETATHFNLVVEYLSGGELVALILKNKGLSEAHAHRLFKQILCAIECCHQNSIIHRDIKLQNIMLDANNNIKLIDFGLSNFVEVGRFRNTFCGTPAYASPEILLGTSYKGPEVDLWSLGVVLYCMLTSEFPFTTIGDILKGTFKQPEGISSECSDLLQKMLTVKKEARATLPDVLNHSWIKRSELEFPEEDCCENCPAGPILKKRRTEEDWDCVSPKSSSSPF